MPLDQGRGDPVADEVSGAFRGLVRPAVAPGSHKGSAVSAAEQKSITAAMKRAYPRYPLVVSLPTLLTENVKAVARELAAEGPAKLPRACS